MTDTAVCSWLMDHADVPIRYRTARELLGDAAKAKALAPALLAHPAVAHWLQTLAPQTPPQHWWMEHGSFDFCLENALCKAVQLGLHGGLPQLRAATGYYLAKMRAAADLPVKRKDFITAVLTANLLTLAGLEDDHVRRFSLDSLRELHRFTQAKTYDLYMSADQQRALKRVPACWKTGKRFIKPEILREYGFGFPLLYDIAGMHALYDLGDPAVDRMIDDVIRYIATDAFHTAVDSGYGIVQMEDGKYYAMGWDPKFPGWFAMDAYFEGPHMPQLLFFALHVSRYPAARETAWFAALQRKLEEARTAEGRYCFPAAWLPEKQGYAVMGSHLSYGENRRNRNWREIESTFHMQLLLQTP